MNLVHGSGRARRKFAPLSPAAAFLLLAFAATGGLAACGGGGGGGNGGSGVVAGDLASVSPDPVTAAHISIEGDFSADYLRSTHFTAMVVEVDYAESRPPTPEALAFLEQRLLERCDKPMSIQVVADDAIPDAEFPSVVSVTKMQQIEDAHRDTFSDEGTATAALYLLYVKGGSSLDSGNGKILGLAHRGGSIAFFMDAALDLENVLYTALDYEAYAIVHETGHLLGLVNGGTPMVNPHEDPSHAGHDSDHDCVMYWSIGGSAFDPHFGDSDFAQFDADCILDMQAFGGL